MISFPGGPIKPVGSGRPIAPHLTKQRVMQAEPFPTIQDWKASLRSGWREVCQHDRWWLVLSVIGWIHLAGFSFCQAMFSLGDRAPIHYLATWLVEFILVVVAIRTIAGKGWWKRSPIAGYALRVWSTFLILSFNSVSLNSFMGLEHDWFKAAWVSLSTFGFAAMAYATTPWFFVPAVQMYFTGLLLVAFPNWNYEIYGVSWWLALQMIGSALYLKTKPAQVPAKGRVRSTQPRTEPEIAGFSG